jgi:hypothetical protein
LKKILLILFIFLVSYPAYSQADKNGGSLYSIFGLGDLSYSTSTRNDGMGIMGFSLTGNYGNSINPAAWTRIQTTIFSSKFNFQRLKSTDGTNNANRIYGNFESFELAVPLNKGNGWIFDLGFNNYSTVNYDAKFTSSIEGEQYTQTYSGNGGLNRLTAGFSYIIFKDFSFGAQFNYLFGNISRNLNIDFSNGLLFDTQNLKEDRISGLYVNTGLIFHGMGKLFKSKKLNDMAIGVYFSTPAQLNSSIIARYNRSPVNIDSVSLTDGKIDLPMSFGAGISNTFKNKLTVAADFYLQSWDNYKYYGVHPLEIRNSMRIGGGVEFTDSKRLEDPYFKRVSYRLGGFYRQDYLKINNEAVNTYGVTAGLTLPISNNNALDLMMQYFIRGKASSGLIKDNVIMLGASVRIGELWFLKPSDEF